MSLLQLPPETLILIFDYVGSSYFRSDLSRLTVCKQWSRFAHTACFQNFYVTQQTLRRLLASLYLETCLPLLKDSMESLDLRLKGFDDWEPTRPAQYRCKGAHVYVMHLPFWNGDHGGAARPTWRGKLNNDLLQLATIIKQSRKLRFLRIQATSEMDPLLRLLGHRDYILLSTISSFLSTKNLSSLELDLCGTQLIQHQNDGEKSHICTSIAALLPTLRCLRLRMRMICADVLKAPQDSTNLRLNEVLINFNLSKGASKIIYASQATNCDSLVKVQLRADMQKQASVLVTQMAAPKMVRILMPTFPSLKTQVFDVLTGKTMELEDGAKWDADGKTIEDEVSDEEWDTPDVF